MSGCPWLEPFSEVGESSDLGPGIFGEGKSFGEMLVGGVIVL